MGFLPLKQCVNRDKKGFATKQRMFGLLIIDEGPSLSMTDGRAFYAGLLIVKPPLDATTRHNLQQVEIFVVTFDNFS